MNCQALEEEGEADATSPELSAIDVHVSFFNSILKSRNPSERIYHSPLAEASWQLDEEGVEDLRGSEVQDATARQIEGQIEGPNDIYSRVLRPSEDADVLWLGVGGGKLIHDYHFCKIILKLHGTQSVRC